jgi:Icc-related predicted phosphoesterase
MAMFRKTPKLPTAGETTIFFASDLHGSEVCFRKFVNAAAFYKADLLVLGGDISGKIVVPIVEAGNATFRAQLHGRDEILTADTVAEFEGRAHNSGFYTKQMGQDAYDHYAGNPAAIEELFSELLVHTVKRWIDLAHTKLAESGTVILNAPGNDDPLIVDDVLREYGDERFRFVENEIVEVAPGHQMISTGYTNHTPWNTHREYTEEQIAERIDSMAAQLDQPESAIFNIHVPPYNSRIDTAPLLGEDLSVQTAAGAPLTAPVGSTAVRAALEKYQPLLSLHGHIHESGGSVKIGRTVAINSGSEYGEGVLRGVLVTVGGGKLLRQQAVSG